MGRDAMSKLAEADELNKTAIRIRKRDPVNARKLDDLASRKRNSAIKQMSRHPKRKSSSQVVIS